MMYHRDIMKDTMKKHFTKIAIVASVATMMAFMAACGSGQSTTPTTAPTTAPTSAAEATKEPAKEPTAQPTEEPVATPEPTKEAKEYKRKAAGRTYTSFANATGYAKLDNYEESDLYVSLTQVSEYENVFWGYSMEDYYAYYPKYFQEYNEDGTVKTDYLQLLKEAVGGQAFVQVNDTIKGYLQKISGLYYGTGYEDYWTYFCFISEDLQEYQQLYDANGKVKVTGYDQDDLYVCAKAPLSYAYRGYTMSKYYAWYSSYGYFTVDGTDYYALLTTAIGDALYAPVTDEIKAILQKISLALWSSEEYWTYFCSVKTEIIPEGKFETVTTDYYKVLEEACGHNTFVQVNDTIKEALKFLSLSYYGDEQYWDYWTYTTYEITGETKAEGGLDYTTLVGTDGEYKTLEYADTDLYVNLDVYFDYAFVYAGYGSYTMAQYYSYGGEYAGVFIKTEVKEVTE